jgi:TRAP-type C4-dicarboxylate transport system substrate-binding protein
LKIQQHLLPAKKRELMKSRWLLCTWVVCVILVFGTCAGYAQVRTPKLATSLSPETTAWQAMTFWQEELARASRNRFMVHMFPEFQLGPEQNVLYGIRFGHIEMALLSVDSLFALSPSLKAISLPYIFRNAGHRWRVLDGPIGRHLLSGLYHYRAMGLGFFEGDPEGIFSFQEPLITPDTFHDAFIGFAATRCVAEEHGQDHNPGLTEDMNELVALRAHPVPVCFEQQEEKMRSGDIAAWKAPLREWTHLTSSVASITALTRIEPAEHLYVLVVNNAWFEGLKPEEQATLSNATRLASLYQRQLLETFEQEQTTRIQNSGIQVAVIQANSLYPAVQSMYARLIAEQGADFEATLQAIERVR